MEVVMKVEALHETVVEKEKVVFSAVEDDEYEVKDKRGRKIIMRRPSPRSEIYFPTLFSAEECQNEPFMMSVKPFAYVAEVGGTRINTLLKKSDLDVLIDILGHDGRNAILLGYAKHFGPKELEEIREIQEEIKKFL